MKNFNTFMIENDLVKKWSGTGLLEGLSDDSIVECAKTMECQRLANENEESSVWLKRMSIPLIRRIFGTVSGLQGNVNQSNNWYECKNYTNFNLDQLNKSITVEEEAKLNGIMAANLSKEISECLNNGKFTSISCIKHENGKLYLNVN